MNLQFDLIRHCYGDKVARTHNSRLASCGLTCINSSAMHLFGFSGILAVECSKIPHERQAANRYLQHPKIRDIKDIKMGDFRWEIFLYHRFRLKIGGNC